MADKRGFRVWVQPGNQSAYEVRFDQDVVTIGRGKKSDLQLDNPIVSRNHAEIIRRAGKIFAIFPHSTTNPTTVNGERIAETVEVDGEDEIMIADIFRIKIVAEKKGGSAPVPGDDEPTSSTRLPATGEANPYADNPYADPDAGAYPQPAADDDDDDNPYASGEVSATTAPQERNPYAESDIGYSPGRIAEGNPYADPADGPFVDEQAATVAEPPPAGSSERRTVPMKAAAPPPAIPVAKRVERVEARPGGARLPDRPPAGGKPKPPVSRGWVRVAQGELSEARSPRSKSGAPGAFVKVTLNGQETRRDVFDDFIIGGSKESDLVLQGAFAARKAALIVKVGSDYRVYNAGPSPNTVTVNDEAVPDQVVLKHDDKLVVYGLSLSFHKRY